MFRITDGIQYNNNMIRIDNIDTYDNVRPFSMTRYYERLCDRNPKSMVL